MDWLTTFFGQYGGLLAQGTWDTIVMVVLSTLLCVATIPLWSMALEKLL